MWIRVKKLAVKPAATSYIIIWMAQPHAKPLVQMSIVLPAENSNGRDSKNYCICKRNTGKATKLLQSKKM
jgi:hypothetical protein